MIVAIYMPREEAVLLADTDHVDTVKLPMADARAIAATILRADRSADAAREIAADRHLARWPRGMRA